MLTAAQQHVQQLLSFHAQLAAQGFDPEPISEVAAMELDVESASDEVLRKIATTLRKKVLLNSRLYKHVQPGPPLTMQGNPAEVFVRSTTTGRCFTVERSKPLVFGSGPGADVDLSTLEAPEPVDATHASIAFDPDQKLFLVRNLSPDNTIFVNYTEALEVDTDPYPLSRSAILEIGGLKFLFHMPAAQSAAVAAEVEGNEP